MATAKKTKAKRSPRTTSGAKKATPEYTMFEKNGVILFTLLAINFMVLAAVKYM